MHPIERHRKAHGWTQTDLARRLSVSLNTVQNWEKGQGPRPANIPRLAEVLGISGHQLVDELEVWRTSQAKGE